jgi:hypothetical protein
MHTYSSKRAPISYPFGELPRRGFSLREFTVKETSRKGGSRREILMQRMLPKRETSLQWAPTLEFLLGVPKRHFPFFRGKLKVFSP